MSGVAALVALLALGCDCAAGPGTAGAARAAPLTADAGYSVLRATGRRVGARPVGRAAASRTRRADLRGGAPVPRAAHAGDAVAGRPLTTSGSYYMPLSFPFTLVRLDGLRAARRGRERDRHPARRRRRRSRSTSATAGSVTARARRACSRPGSRTATCRSCRPRTPTPRGVRYRQESFVGRAYGVYGARSVISFVRLDVDARTASRGATVRLVPWRRLAHTAPDRLALGGQTRLIVSDGADFVDGVVRYRVPRGESQTIYADWLNAPSDARYVHANAAAYDAARGTVVGFWQSRLDAGATFDVPEPAVQNAERGILTQLIAYGWRYSIGNPYEELSYAESLDAAEVAAEYGYPSVAKSIIEFSLAADASCGRGGSPRFAARTSCPPRRTYYRLTHDRAFLRAETPALDGLVGGIAARQRRTRAGARPARAGAALDRPRGPRRRQRLRPDRSGRGAARDRSRLARDRLPGARGESARALARVDRPRASARNHPRFGAAPRRLAVRARPADDAAAAVRPAHRDARRLLLEPRHAVRIRVRLVPAALADVARDPSLSPEPRRAAPRRAANLCANGLRRRARSRVWRRSTASSTSRFLADNDQPDQLVLSLYGMLAAGMTADTYISGEAVSVLPVNGAYDRTMFMPPNSGANASYLETLRELLVHERRGPLGAPAGLDLAFSTPRAWLADGQQIDVHDAPTSFGEGDLLAHRAPARRSRAGSSCRRVRTVASGSDSRRASTCSRVLVGSTSVAADRAGTIDLGSRRGAVLVRATVR